MRNSVLSCCFIATALLAMSLAPLTSYAADGKALYDAKCKSCHSIGGDGGPMASLGGSLDGVGSKRDATWLKAYFADPPSKIEGSKMPKMKLPDDEWQALIAYMLTLE